MPSKPRKKDDDDYVPSDSEESDSPEESTSRPPRGRPKKKSTESSTHSDTSKHSLHSKKSASRNSSYASSSSIHNPRTGSKVRHHVGTKIVRKATRRPVRRQNTLVVSKTSTAEESETRKKIIPKIVVRNPTHKVVKMPKKKMDPGMLAPPQPKRKRKKKVNVAKAPSDNSSDDKILATLPLPSSSIPHVFNKNISLIGSINIQAFGIKKWSNHVILRIIADILRKYDIVLCQEVHIPKGKEELLQKLVEEVSTPATPYSYIASDPIGRSSYQERYLYMYRKNEWKVLDSYIVDDEKLGDKFIREPYVVRFQHLRKPNVRITLVGCHTQPENAFDEIKVLVSDVYVNVKNKLHRDTIQEKRQLNRDRSVQEKAKKETEGFISRLRSLFGCCFPVQEEKEKKETRGFISYLCSLCFPKYSPVSTREAAEDAEEFSFSKEGSGEPIVMMGDLNAAGSYVNKKQRAELDEILQKNKLMWGILHSSDTTVAEGSNAAYDRFVYEVANERRWIGNTKVWRFDESWENEPIDKTLIKKAAKRITDHYPIEFELKI